MADQQKRDAALFSMVHSLLQDGSEHEGSERRAFERHRYDCMQWVAPYDGVTLPIQGDFCKVHCQDLSSAGFSFHTPVPPRSEYVIVALGAIPFVFLSARIARILPMESHRERSWLVGCRFNGRVTGRDVAWGDLEQPRWA